MNYNLIVTETAENHISDACEYYDSQLPGLSQRFLKELYVEYQKIATNPEHYSFISSLPDDIYRDIKVYKFPFVVIFRIEGNDVIVIAVFNTYRKPRY